MPGEEERDELIPPPVRYHPHRDAVFTVPVVWLVWRLATPVGGRWHQVYRGVDLVLITLTLVTLPLTLWAVARIVAPDYFALSTLKLRLTGAAIVLAVGVAGFFTGHFNNHVVTCQDFNVAGDDEPANCRGVVPTDSPS